MKLKGSSHAASIRKNLTEMLPLVWQDEVEKLDDVELQIVEHILSDEGVTKNGRINKSALCRLLGVHQMKIEDILGKMQEKLR